MGSVSDGALKAASSEMENVAPLSAPFGGFCPQLCPAASADFRPRPCASPGRVRSETRDIPPSPEEGLSANPRCRDVRPFPAPGTDPASPRRLAVHPMAERKDPDMPPGGRGHADEIIFRKPNRRQPGDEETSRLISYLTGTDRSPCRALPATAAIRVPAGGGRIPATRACDGAWHRGRRLATGRESSLEKPARNAI